MDGKWEPTSVFNSGISVFKLGACCSADTQNTYCLISGCNHSFPNIFAFLLWFNPYLVLNKTWISLKICIHKKWYHAHTKCYFDHEWLLLFLAILDVDWNTCKHWVVWELLSGWFVFLKTVNFHTFFEKTVILHKKLKGVLWEFVRPLRTKQWRLFLLIIFF